jgi:hypothetical protein
MMSTLPIPEDFLFPEYRDGTLANLPATVAALLDVPFEGLPQLRKPLWSPVKGRTKRIIVLLLDSLGWEIYRREWDKLEWLRSRLVVEDKISTVFPSTTVAALSSLSTGYAPAQHGLVGLRLFFPHFGVIGQTISFGPAYRREPGALIEAGLDPEKFLAVPSFNEQLAAAGIESHSFKGSHIVHSALSIMHERGVTKKYGFFSAADMVVLLRQVLEERADKSLYAKLYWPAIDSICHFRGPDHPAVGAELVTSLKILKTELLDQLSPEVKKDTIIIITGDHGHVTSPADRSIKVEDHPALEEMLLMRPAGEPRTVYLYARQGCQQAIVDYLNTHLNHALVAFPANQVLSSGAFGPRPHAKETARRIGDVVVLMRDGYTLLSRKEAAETDRFIGLHGGMTRKEMIVPWLLLPLGD